MSCPNHTVGGLCRGYSMIISKNKKRGRIFTGPEIRNRLRNTGYDLTNENHSCPTCGKQLTFNDGPVDEPFDYFSHTDGSTDCFKTASTSDDHRLMIEATIKLLHNRISEVTGEPVEIDAERWIGIREDFVITDVLVTNPVRIAVELFYRTETLGLGRRLNTMFTNNYQTYLVFHRDGRHNIDKIEHHLQQIAPLNVGRFDPDTLELTLGDLFTEDQFDLTESSREKLPNYIS